MRWHEILGKPEQFTFVAEEEGEVIGFVNGGPEREGCGDFCGEIYALYRLGEFRGRGIGRKLFLQTAARPLERGMTSMLAWVLEKNPYRHFYERMGGLPVDGKTIEIAGQELGEAAYGWNDLQAVVEAEGGG